MPKAALIKPTHKAIKQYHQALKDYREQRVTHEGALETAFQRLLADTAKLHHCTLIPKQKIKVGKNNIFPDGTVRDTLYDTRLGFWEAKDRVPELAKGLVSKLDEAHKGNKKFQAAFESFLTICQRTLNPNISRAAVDEMLVQHLSFVRGLPISANFSVASRRVSSYKLKGYFAEKTQFRRYD